MNALSDPAIARTTKLRKFTPCKKQGIDHQRDCCANQRCGIMNLREFSLKGWISAFLFFLLPLPSLIGQGVVDCGSLRKIITAMDTNPAEMRGEFGMDFFSGETYWETAIQYDGITGTFYPSSDGYVAELATYRVMNTAKSAGVELYLDLLTGDMQECLGSRYSSTILSGPNNESVNVFFDKRDAVAAGNQNWQAMKYPFINLLLVPVADGAESYIDLEIAVP